MTIRVFALALLAALVMGTEYNPCKTGDKGPTALRVKNCETLPCEFVRGEDISAEVDFVADHNIMNLKPKSVVDILGGTLEFPLPEPDGCKSLVSAVCPLEQGDRATYQLSLPILAAYPTVPLSTEISLADPDTNQVVFCFNITGNVV